MEAIEPLQVVRFTCNDADNGIFADLTFSGRCPAIEEPRFAHRLGSPMVRFDGQRPARCGEPAVAPGHPAIAPPPARGILSRLQLSPASARSVLARAGVRPRDHAA